MKKVKYKLSKGEIFNLYEGLKNIPSYAHSDLQYAKHRTLKFLESEYQTLLNMKNEALNKGREYDEEIHTYLLTICKPDVLGRPKAFEQNGLINYDIMEDKQNEATEKRKELDEKYKSYLEEREKLLRLFNEMMADTSEDKKVNVFVCQIKYTQDIRDLKIGNDMEYAYILFDENSILEEEDKENTESEKVSQNGHGTIQDVEFEEVKK